MYVWLVTTASNAGGIWASVFCLLSKHTLLVTLITKKIVWYNDVDGGR